MTHYIKAFTVIGADGTEQATCGKFVYPAEHSPEPECTGCQRWIDALAAPPITHVLVRQRVFLASLGQHMVTDWSASRARADRSEDDFVTVRALSGGVIKTFEPDAWESVSVRDAEGEELFGWANDRAWASHKASLKLRRRSA